MWHLFALVNKVHGAWRWYRKAELYTTPDRFFELLTGHFLHFVAGDLLIVRIAAQSLLIATRILECSQQQAAFCKTGSKWLLAFCSDSEEAGEQRLWERVALRIRAVAHYSLKLLEKGFRLSMGILDALDALCLNPHASCDAMQESIVNIVKWIDAVVENREQLLSKVDRNRQIIERLLERSSLSYDQFYAALSRTIEGTRAVQKKVRIISRNNRKRLLQIGGQAAACSLVLIGLANVRKWLRLTG
jgi:hypothetical protein